MDYIKLLELGMKPCQHILDNAFKEENITKPYSSKAYTDSDYARSSLDRNLQQDVVNSLDVDDIMAVQETDSGCQIPQQNLNIWPASSCKTEIPHSSSPMENVADEAVHKERGDSLVGAGTTASSLEAEQDSGLRITASRGNTLRSGEDSLKLNELIELCIILQQRVLDLETTKTTQANEIASLKMRVKKLEKKDISRTHKLKRLYKVGLSARVESSGDGEDLGEDASKQWRIADINVDAGITLVSTRFYADTDMFGVHDLVGDEVVVESEVAVKAGEKRSVVEKVVVVIDVAKLKSAKPKADKVVIQEPEQGTTTTTPTTIIPVPKPLQDKGKRIMIEEPVVEQVKPIKRLEQMRLDEEFAFKLQAKEEEEEERLAREKDQQIKEANIA
ncbi:hypothetical protein Tco_1318315 [Tanacetum coccineum]